MKLALLMVVVVGAVIGAILPVPKRPAPAVAVAQPVDAPRETVLARSPAGHFYAVAEVNGEPIRFLVDTGASTVAFSEEDARRAKLAFDPNSYQPVGRGAAGIVRGQEVWIGRLALDGKEAQDVRAVVMQEAEMSLLGQNYLRRLDVRISGDTMTLRRGPGPLRPDRHATRSRPPRLRGRVHGGGHLRRDGRVHEGAVDRGGRV